MSNGQNYGDDHPNAGNFVVLFGAMPIHFHKFGAIKSTGKTYGTSDGRQHTGAKREAVDVTAEMYVTNPAEVQFILNLHRAFLAGKSGYKMPASRTTLGLDDVPTEVLDMEEVFVKEVESSASDEENPTASTLTVVLSVYGVEKTL